MNDDEHFLWIRINHTFTLNIMTYYVTMVIYFTGHKFTFHVQGIEVSISGMGPGTSTSNISLAAASL